MKVAVYQKVVVADFFVHIMFKRLKIAKNMHEIKKYACGHMWRIATRVDNSALKGSMKVKAS